MPPRGRRPFSLSEARAAGARIGVRWGRVTPGALRRGMNVELEHGRRDPATDVTHDDPVLTARIALAHLRERLDYYDVLERAEAAPRPRTRHASAASNESLAYLLGARGRIPQVGAETGRVPRHGVGVFKSVAATPGTSFRYVYAVDGALVAALQVMVAADRTARIANVYTAPAHRRRGYASTLLARAEKDLGLVAHSDDLSPAGATWRDSVARASPPARLNPAGPGTAIAVAVAVAAVVGVAAWSPR